MSDTAPLLPTHRGSGDEITAPATSSSAPESSRALSSPLQGENEAKPSTLRRLFRRLLRLCCCGAKDDAADDEAPCSACCKRHAEFLAYEQEMRAIIEQQFAANEQMTERIVERQQEMNRDVQKHNEQMKFVSRAMETFEEEKARFEEMKGNWEREKVKWENEMGKRGKQSKIAVTRGSTGVVQPVAQPVRGGSSAVRRPSATVSGGGAAAGPSRLLEKLDEFERNKKWEEQQAKKASEAKMTGKGKGKETEVWKPRSDAK